MSFKIEVAEKVCWDLTNKRKRILGLENKE
jgi:hypothetical protein